MNRLIRITAAASLLALFQSGSLAAQPAASLTKGATYGTGTTLELRFDQPTTVSHIITMEDIRQGHIIRTYEVDGLVDGQWQKLVEGQSVGYKKIDVIKAATVSALRLRVIEAVDEPVIKSFAAYEAATLGVPGVEMEKQDALWQRVEECKDLKLGPWQTVDFELTPYIREPGQYEVELRRTGGSGTVEIGRVVVVMADNEAPRLISALDRGRAWNINRTAAITPDNDGRNVLRLKIRNTSGYRWDGAV